MKRNEQNNNVNVGFRNFITYHLIRFFANHGIIIRASKMCFYSVWALIDIFQFEVKASSLIKD